MPNTSATGGPLQPTSAPPLDDSALDDFLQSWIVNLIGGAIPGAFFFPRWQIDPPNYPGPTVNWASIGITSTPAQLFPVVQHFDGYDQEQFHEWIDIMLSFYGPNCRSIARQLRDSVYVAQNLEVLDTQSIKLTETGNIITLPDLRKERYLYKVDFSVKLRREIVRIYAVENIESANGTVNNESYTTAVVAFRAPGIVFEAEGNDIVHIVAQVSSIGSVMATEKSDIVVAH